MFLGNVASASTDFQLNGDKKLQNYNELNDKEMVRLQNKI